jgi:hypothetical protein
MIDGIEFATNEALSPDELVQFYQKLHHETTRSREKLERMLEQAYCIVTARRAGELVGLARGVTDGLTGRLAECKLDSEFQGPACITKTDGRIEHDSEGIAAEMARRVVVALRAYGVETIEVMAYGTEVDFCEDMGFRPVRGVVMLALDDSVSVIESPVVVLGGASQE